MPQQLPDIPKVDRKTSYQGLKGIVAKLRDEFIRSYLVDSASVTVVDNPGKTRSAEVNFPNQGGGGATATITLDGSETVPDGGIFKTFSVALDVPNGTPIAVDTGAKSGPSHSSEATSQAVLHTCISGANTAPPISPPEPLPCARLPKIQS